MSGGAALAQGSFVEEEHDGPTGDYALRRLIAPLRVRETLVIPLKLDSETLEVARTWRALYAAEPAWLDFALTRFALPAVAEIFAP